MDHYKDFWLETFFKFVREGDERAAFVILKKLRELARIMALTTFHKSKESDCTWEDIADEALLKLLRAYKDKAPQDMQQQGRSSFFRIMYITVFRLYLKPKAPLSEQEPDTLANTPETEPDHEALLNEERRLLHTKIERCMQRLKQRQEFKWFVLTAWMGVKDMLPENHELRAIIKDKSGDTGRTETERIQQLILRINNDFAHLFGLEEKSKNKINRGLNDNTLKADIRRAKDFLKDCLMRSGIFPDF